MKRILVTGENSYIGTSFVTYMEQFKEEYEVETISVRGNEWRGKDFSIYDVVYHVAGIAHQRESKKNKSLYKEVNFILTKEIADKAKKEGVKQFIYLSSMSVYGAKEGIINQNTEITPFTEYGKSKYEAEKYLQSIESKEFLMAIVRPPMVYGKKCKGNYESLSKFAKITPYFPNYKNVRSMIFIDNLSIVIVYLITKKFNGICLPQNKEYISTNEMIYEISKVNNKRIKTNKLFNGLIKFFLRNSLVIKKVFGDLNYDKSISFNDADSFLIEFKETIKLTERG